MLTAFPLLFITFILYNIFVLAGRNDPGITADIALRQELIGMTMPSGGRWVMGVGDLLVLFSLILLFFELLKSTSSQKVAIVNHALSMVLFIFCLVEFLLFPSFATATFFLITVMVLLDVMAGFIVTIITARKDFDFGAGGAA